MPRDAHAYAASIASMTDDELFDEAKTKIWLSAFASNNPSAPSHDDVDAIYAECHKREDTELYRRAHRAVMKECGY